MTAATDSNVYPSAFEHHIDRLFVTLFGTDAYAIGGRVRDSLINRFFGTHHPCKDFDYVITNHDLEAVIERLLSVRARVDAVGASFAVLKVTIDGTTVDVALPRRDRSTGTGHRDFVADFGSDVSLEDDQCRRDFTMNAISVRLANMALIAAPGAIDDLRTKTIRALSPTAFTEDPLRMLRAVQFSARLSFTIEPTTRAVIRDNAGLLATVSPERINEELCKLLLRSSRPSDGIRDLVELGLMPYVIPELLESINCTQNKHHAHDVFGHLCATLDAAATLGGDLVDRLAAVLHDVGKPRTAAPRADGDGNTFYGHEDVGADMTTVILRRLRFSEEIVTTVTSLVRQHMFVCTNSDGSPLSDPAVRRLMRRFGTANIERQFTLRESDMRGSASPRDIRRQAVTALHERMTAIAATTPALTITQLAINGHDVIDYLIANGTVAANYRGDQRVGNTLAAVLELVIDQPEINERAQLLARLPHLTA
jgi:tRNA nucleotidyltransferase (CCA-adding enzyme)